MAAVEQRIAYLEGRMNEQAQHVPDLKADMRDLRTDIRRVEGRIDALDEKVSKHFIWLVGMQITTLVAIVGALLSRGT